MPPADVHTPLTGSEIEELLAPVAEVDAFAIAVSGGADSLALLVAVEGWRRGRTRPVVTVLTVDHGLSNGSAAEAARVAAIARERGFAARILAWTGPRPKADIEATARSARYGLLLQAAREAGASHILLAHHRDDQAETFLMRLQRGSGVFGLAAMRPETNAGGTILFRPFLNVPRVRLAATTASAGLVPFEDPMNRDPRFLRARVRRLMPFLAAEGFDAKHLAATAARFASAAEAIDAAVDQLIAKAVSVDEFAVARFDRSDVLAVPKEVQYRFLARLVVAVGGGDYPPRFERIESLLEALAAYSGGRFKRTLGGTVVEGRRGAFLLYRESGRDGLPEWTVGAGFRGIFDHRFAVSVADNAPDGLTLGPLGEAGRREIGARAGTVPPGPLATLPAVRKGKEILAIPAIPLGSQGCEAVGIEFRQIVSDRLLEPPRFPDLGKDDQKLFTAP